MSLSIFSLKSAGLKNKPSVITWLALMVFFVIAILPLLLMLEKSVVIEGHFSLSHYVDIFSEPRIFNLLGRSCIMALGATLLSLVLGVPFALILSGSNFAGKKLCTLFCLFPLFIPSHIHALAWISLFGDRGLITLLLMELTHTTAPLFTIYNTTASTILLSLSYFPIVVLLVLIGLESMDRRLEEAASLVLRPLPVQTRVILPLISPFILSGAVFVFIFSFFNYGVPSMLRVSCFPIEIFVRFSAFFDERGATALSLPIIVLAFTLLLFQRYYMQKKSYVTIGPGYKRINSQSFLGKNKITSSYIYMVLFCTVFLPLCALVLQAGSAASYIKAFSTSFQEMKTSVSIAVISATLSSLLAYFITRHITIGKEYNGCIIDILTYLPFAFPATLFGIGLIHLWNTPMTQMVYSTSCILVIACTARFIPFGIRIVSAGIQQIHCSLGESAYLCEKSWWKRFWYIEFPLVRKSLCVCWLIIFIFSMGELGATLILVPPGLGTLPLKIYTFMHYGAGALVAALALILIGGNLLVSSGIYWSNQSGWNRG